MKQKRNRREEWNENKSNDRVYRLNVVLVETENITFSSVSLLHCAYVLSNQNHDENKY